MSLNNNDTDTCTNLSLNIQKGQDGICIRKRNGCSEGEVRCDVSLLCIASEWPLTWSDRVWCGWALEL